ncbi:hypothetical protein M406DRAFT_57604, partial [Cryphonectria parasitica EP155]
MAVGVKKESSRGDVHGLLQKAGSTGLYRLTQRCCTRWTATRSVFKSGFLSKKKKADDEEEEEERRTGGYVVSKLNRFSFLPLFVLARSQYENICNHRV